MSLIAGRGCRWPPRRDSVSPVRTVVGGGRDTHDGHENSPILVFFSNLLGPVEARSKLAGYEGFDRRVFSESRTWVEVGLFSWVPLLGTAS